MWWPSVKATSVKYCLWHVVARESSGRANTGIHPESLCLPRKGILRQDQSTVWTRDAAEQVWPGEVGSLVHPRSPESTHRIHTHIFTHLAFLCSGDPPTIKLCDFGFAKNWEDQSNMFTQIGTPVYMVSGRHGHARPEQDARAQGNGLPGTAHEARAGTPSYDLPPWSEECCQGCQQCEGEHRYINLRSEFQLPPGLCLACAAPCACAQQPHCGAQQDGCAVCVLWVGNWTRLL